MSSKLVLIALTALLCTGICQALDCYLCAYQVQNGQEQQMSVAECKTGELTDSSNKETCSEAGSSCFVQYAKTDNDNYSWGRGCQAACNNTQITTQTEMWIRCCDDDDLCNDQTEYGDESGESQDDDQEQCYSCTYTEENGEATSGSDEKCKNAVDDTITKVACTTNCFVELTTVDNTTTLTRGCKEACTNMEEQEDGDFRVCCNDKDLCNDQNEPETSGTDVIFRQSNVMSAMIAVVMAMCVAWLEL